jgi:hypothetical protein
MRRLALVLALLVVSLVHPARAWADAGLSWELRGPRTAEPRREATVAPATSEPATLLASQGASLPALVERGGRSRTPAERVKPATEPRAGCRRSRGAARSRMRAVELSFLGSAPSRAEATRGVVGHHASPAPPRPS